MTVEDFNKEELGVEEEEVKIVDVYPGKPGLDVKNGRFKVLGAVTLHQVFKKQQSGTNIAPADGYHIEEIETGRKLIVEKSQGVKICEEMGMTNAYITHRVKTEKSSEGEVLQTRSSIYLFPYPSRKEAFTQDDRLITAFKMDDEGKLVQPYELMITEDQCTPEFWRMVMKKYEQGNKKPKKSRRGSEDHHRKMMEKLKTALNKREHVRNPFKD